MGEGADEALKVVDLEDGEGEEETAAAGSSRETRMLPRMPVRVLLAEGDDSTRHVISALLRKCGYRDLGEDFTNMTVEPPDELQFPILGALPDLNMGLPDEEELFQFHEAQFAQLVGSDITGGQNEGISSVHANDEQHQPNRDGWPILDLNAHPPDDEQQAVGEAIPDLNVQATYDDHQPDGEAIPDLNVQPANFDQQPDVDIAFDVIDEQDDFDLNLLVPAQHEEMQQIAAASDGVKAWDILQEKSFNIDLVLTEVDLPLMSGFLLLSTIMEHDASKNIPVIMMSSHDSVSMVFKCMLKGAADFLVKPIRKNELRNLWQHVWRKQLANGGPDVQHIQNEENLAERIEQKIAVTKVDNLNKDGACKDRECSEQESDAQVGNGTVC